MRKQKYKILLWVAGIGLFALVVTAPKIVTAIREQKAVEHRFAQYSSALVDGEFGQAYQYCGTAFREATSFEAFGYEQEDLRAQFGDLRSVKKRGTVVSIKSPPAHWAALITADLEYETQTVRFVFEFHYELGRWVLFGYKPGHP